MNPEYERMKKLLEGLGVTFKEGGFTNAEIYAYSIGIGIVRSGLEQLEAELFLLTDGASDFRKYADLLRLDTSRFTAEGLRSAIISRLGKGFAGDYAEDFDKAFGLIGSGEYTISASNIAFRKMNGSDLKELGKFMKAYLPYFEHAYYDGGGMPFDNWEALALSFNTFDGLGLPFDILDRLRSDYFEQLT